MDERVYDVGGMEDELSDCLFHLDNLDTGDDGDQQMPFLSYLDNPSTFNEQDSESTCFAQLDTIPEEGLYGVQSPMPSYVGNSLFKLREKHCPSVYGSQDQQPEGIYPPIETDLKSPESQHTPDRPTLSSAGRQSKTPRTLLRLQEKHRENERVRHHTLNKSMKSLCSKVPGYDESAKETKVVMMQRVVDYICDLEHNVQGLCDEMGIKLDLTNTFLTAKMKEKKDGGKRQGRNRSPSRKVKDPILATYIPETVDLDELGPISESKVPPMTPSSVLDQKLKSRRQKISSPTVGSSSDVPVTMQHEDNAWSQSSGSSQDSAKPAPSNIPFTDDVNMPSPVNWIGSDVYDVVSFNTKDEFVYLLSPEKSSLGFEQSDDFTVSSTLSLGSPVRRINEIGSAFIVNDVSMDTDTEADLKAINPDSVLHMRTPSRPDMTLQDKLAQLIEMKNEPFVERPPLTAITNTMKKGKDPTSCSIAEDLDPIVDKNLRKDIGRRDDDHFVSYVPYMWKFHDMAMTRRQKAAAARLEAQGEKENIVEDPNTRVKEDKPVKAAKIDHRKTSWMNGFMMFSRLNRRKFIQANPGVHTSHISKMMGHSWRNMGGEEQQPYKEKAKKYMQHMQKSHDTEKFDDPACRESSTGTPLTHVPVEKDTMDGTTHDKDQLQSSTVITEMTQESTIDALSSPLDDTIDISQLQDCPSCPQWAQYDTTKGLSSTLSATMKASDRRDGDSPSLGMAEDIAQLLDQTTHSIAISTRHSVDQEQVSDTVNQEQVFDTVNQAQVSDTVNHEAVLDTVDLEVVSDTVDLEGMADKADQALQPMVSHLVHLNDTSSVHLRRVQSDNSVTVTPNDTSSVHLRRVQSDNSVTVTPNDTSSVHLRRVQSDNSVTVTPNDTSSVHLRRVQSDNSVTVTPTSVHGTQNSGIMFAPQSRSPSATDNRTLYVYTLPKDQSHPSLPDQETLSRNMIHCPSSRLAELLQVANLEKGRVVILSSMKPGTGGVITPEKIPATSKEVSASPSHTDMTDAAIAQQTTSETPCSIPRNSNNSSKSMQPSKVTMTPTKYFQAKTSMVSLLPPVVCTPELMTTGQSSRITTALKSPSSGRRKSPCPRRVNISEHAKRQSVSRSHLFRDGSAQTDFSPGKDH